VLRLKIRQSVQYKLSDIPPLCKSLLAGITEMYSAIEARYRSFVGRLNKGIEMTFGKTEINFGCVGETEMVTQIMR